MGSDSKQVPQIPKIDLTGLRPSSPGGDRWETAKTAVASALLSHGCFEAVFPSLSAELREEMFGIAAPELFSLPLESKLRSISDDAYHGYIGQIPHLAYETLNINDVDSPIAVHDFTHLMWPEGNPSFSNAAAAFAKPLQDLVQIVQKMILQNLGVEKHYDSLASSITHLLRISDYGVPLNQETKIALDPHRDPNLLTVVCQHKIGGLEVQTADGDWIIVEPSPNSVNVMAGLAFQAWSNMRVRAPRHRVKMLGNEKRFSAIYGTRPSHNSVVKGPKELGDDEDHPMLYKPFNYTEFLHFIYYSRRETGRSPDDAFERYCRLEN